MRTLLILLAALVSIVPVAVADELAPGVSLIRGAFVPGSQPDGNTVFLAGPDGLVVVDTGRHVEHTSAIVEFVRAGGKPLAAIVNTHWHLDHIGGNALLRSEFPGVRVHASGTFAGARTRFLANYRGQLEDLIAKIADPDKQQPFRAELALLDSADRLAPDVVIERSGKLMLGGRELRVSLEQNAVTAGDVWLLDRASGVLIAGDLVTLPAPFLDTACPEGWQRALRRLERTEFTTLVPGHGPPLDREQARTYRSAYDGLLACAESGVPPERCIDEWLAGTAGLDPARDDAFTRELMAYYVGLLRNPQHKAKFCPR